MSLRTIEYATNTNKKYFYTFRINQITFTYGERKKERPNFYGMFSQNLPISAAFTAILKMKLPQCNAIGVRTPPGLLLSTLCIKATLFPQRQQGRNDSDRFLGLQLECKHVPMFLFTAQKYYLNIPVLRVPCW